MSYYRKSAPLRGAEESDALASLNEGYLELERRLLNMALVTINPNAAPDTPKLTIPQALTLLKMHHDQMKLQARLASRMIDPIAADKEAKAELLALFMRLKDSRDAEELRAKQGRDYDNS
jgi:hypothetical protein